MRKKITTISFIYFILPILLVFILPVLVHAQPGFTDTVDDVPVDGGLTLLVAAGIGYGAKKLKERRNK
jgi:hypothetical protein